MEYVVSPIVIVGVTAAAGAVALLLLFMRAGVGGPLLGLLLGAGAGAGGALLAMVPLGFCPFEAERMIIDFIIGGVIIALVTAAVLLVVRFFAVRWRRGQQLLPEGEASQGAFNTRWVTPALLLLPTMVILLVFLYYPMFETFRLSTQLARLGAPRQVFICVDNFSDMFGMQVAALEDPEQRARDVLPRGYFEWTRYEWDGTTYILGARDPEYYYSVFVSFFIAASIVIVGLSLSLFIATMAYQPIKGARVYRILLVWPYALSPVIAGIIFQLLFNPTAGVINHMLRSAFGFDVPWLLDRNIAPLTIVAASVWNILGFNILFYIAGLQNVPKDLEEAAAIDGANALQRFFRITFPLLSPITFFLVVTNTTYAFFDTFGLIDFLTAGGPSRATTTMMYNVYVTGIVSNNLGAAAAQSLMLFLLVIGVTIFQFQASRGRVTYGG